MLVIKDGILKRKEDEVDSKTYDANRIKLSNNQTEL